MFLKKKKGQKRLFHESSVGVPQYFSFSVNYESCYIFTFRSVYFFCACAHAFTPWHRLGGHRTTFRSHFSPFTKFQESHPGHQALEASTFTHGALLLVLFSSWLFAVQQNKVLSKLVGDGFQTDEGFPLFSEHLHNNKSLVGNYLLILVLKDIGCLILIEELYHKLSIIF